MLLDDAPPPPSQRRAGAGRDAGEEEGCLGRVRWGGARLASASASFTFGRGAQPAASRCSCSEVWLGKRSEQQAVRPSLFIREEMMLQPQPHIDLLI